MKREFKQLIVVFALVIALLAVGFLVSGCGKKQPDPTQTTTDPVWTIPTSGDSTSSSETTKSSETTATNDTSTTASSTKPVVPPSGEYTNPLTGLPCKKDVSAKRPIAIIVDNIQFAYPRQSGLTQADILYEGLVAPGITRFMAVIADYDDLNPICNLRSGRDYHIFSAFNHDAILVCHSGAIVASPSTNELFASIAERLYGRYVSSKGKIYYGYVNTKDEARFSQAESGKKYGTIKNYGARKDLQWDTLFVSSAFKDTLKYGLCTYVKGFSADRSKSESLSFMTYGTSANMPNAQTANRVIVSFSLEKATGSKNVEYTYTNGRYYRNQDGSAHKDAVTGEQLSFKNLITLNTQVTNYTGTKEDPNLADIVVIGSGTGMYISEGKAIEIRWSKSGETTPLVLTYADGTPLKLNAGNTCISFVNKADATSVRVLG